MSEEIKNPIIPGSGNEKAKSSSSYIWLGLAAVGFLLLVIVAMLVVTGGDVAETKAPTALVGNAAEGRTLYLQSNCNGCHPAEGRAGGVGPRLSTTGLSDESIRSVVRKGKGVMPANSQLTDEQLNKLVSYIRAIKPE